MHKSIVILVADDDEEDRLLMQEAMDEAKLVNTIKFVEDGVVLMNYLKGAPPYDDRRNYPFPGLILLDLNMPRKDGRECIEEIKQNPLLKRIPIVVLSTSRAEEDILRTYDLGVSSFITKPVSFESLVEVMNSVGNYWLKIVELP